jgi:hypothetical protein
MSIPWTVAMSPRLQAASKASESHTGPECLAAGGAAPVEPATLLMCYCSAKTRREDSKNPSPGRVAPSFQRKKRLSAPLRPHYGGARYGLRARCCALEYVLAGAYEAAASNPEADPEGVVSHNAICDCCDFPITSVRYKCLNCPDYDLCS